MDDAQAGSGGGECRLDRPRETGNHQSTTVANPGSGSCSAHSLSNPATSTLGETDGPKTGWPSVLENRSRPRTNLFVSRALELCLRPFFGMRLFRPGDPREAREPIGHLQPTRNAVGVLLSVDPPSQQATLPAFYPAPDSVIENVERRAVQGCYLSFRHRSDCFHRGSMLGNQ